MKEFYHAHEVNMEKCRGHMTCMRHCPTQAIRVRGGKAQISEELCVDCGVCLSVCKADAVVPITDPVGEISQFKYKVVVPSPVLYSQFDSSIHPYIIHLALKKLGFDKVVDVNISSAVVGRALVKYMGKHEGRRPLISSHCPSLVRLIQVKYPDLVELVLPIEVPREIAAREIKKELSRTTDMKLEDIGVIYIAPCPAKIVSIKQPAEKARSWFDGANSIKDVYSILLPHIAALKETFDESQIPKDFFFSPGWSMLGSITRTVQIENWLAVSGLDHVMQILDDIESSRLRNVEFVEALTCMLGCIGGPYAVENPYVTRSNTLVQRIKYEDVIEVDDEDVAKKLEDGYLFIEEPVLPRPTKFFDTDLETSIKRIKGKEKVYQKLRQIDCGCCGAPTCMAFAEDFVRGEAELTDCIFLAQEGGEE